MDSRRTFQDRRERMAGDVVAQSGEADAGQQAISPQRLAHFVLRTSRFEELVDWYQTVLGATPAFKNELLAFLSYDEEQDRKSTRLNSSHSCASSMPSSA